MSRIAAAAADPVIAIRDQLLGPCVMYPFAENLARRLARINMRPMLEVGADTGALTQATALAMSADVTIVATDPDPAAIEYAQGKPGMARIAWQTADARALPFKDATFGITTCLFAVAEMTDPVRAFREVRRVTKPGGRFLFAVPARLRHNPVAECIDHALAEAFPSCPPRFLSGVMHGYADSEAIDNDLTAAGFTDAIYTTVELPLAAAHARDIALGYCRGTPLRNQIAAAGDEDHAFQAVSAALQRRFGAGRIVSTMRALVILASG